MGDTGLEFSRLSACSRKELQQSSGAGGAESGSLPPDSAQTDPDLRRLVDAWPTLPDAVKADILGMIEADTPDRGGR